MTERTKRLFWVGFLVAAVLINLAWFLWPQSSADWGRRGPMFDPGTPR